jgi:hypothetical protein
MLTKMRAAFAEPVIRTIAQKPAMISFLMLIELLLSRYRSREGVPALPKDLRLAPTKICYAGFTGGEIRLVGARIVLPES